MLTTQQIRAKFIEFFEQQQHQAVKSSSLIPGNDPTLLFVNAGMVQFKDVFLGAEKRQYTRATSSQRCVRAGGKHNDLDQVGYTARHHTFFEMLGNFSFGDYFKREAIQYAWDFLTKELNLPVEKLWVTVFEEDDEAERIWRDEIGFPADKISRIGAKDNFWQMGDTGPCGPCTEIFYDHGEAIEGGPPGTPEEDGDRYIEIWNLVFMQYDKQADGSLVPLPNPCVDTGMGLERIASIMQGKHNNYDIDLFQHLIKRAAELTGAADLGDPSLKVIADHIRTCAFLIADGVMPSNEGRGYVLRRIIRRAARHGHKLGAQGLFFYQMVEPLKAVMGEDYLELIEQQASIEKALKKEEQKFSETLDIGMQEYRKATQKLPPGADVSGAVAFKLYDTFGFPFDLTQDVAREDGRLVDEEAFIANMQSQKERSRSSKQFTQSNQISADLIQALKPTVFTGYQSFAGDAKVKMILKDNQAVDHLNEGETGVVVLDQTPFYAESGGQVGDIGQLKNSQFSAKVTDTQKAAGQFHLHHITVESGVLNNSTPVQAEVDGEYRQKVILNHSATHLLHKILRAALGNHVQQKGSLVNADKLRFDFSHDQPITPEELAEVEREVNEAIRQNFHAQDVEMSYDQAIEYGAMALFGEKYGDQVRVMDFGGFSVELCGGTHVNSTGEIGLFKIIEETAVASGIRRIEAVTGDAAIALVQTQAAQLKALSQRFNVQPANLDAAVESLLSQNKQLEKSLNDILKAQASESLSDINQSVVEVDGVNYLQHVFNNSDLDVLRDAIDGFKSRFEQGVVVLANLTNGKAQVLVGVTKAMTQTVKAGDVIKQVLGHIGGRGGGRPDFAQGGGEANEAELTKAIGQTLEAVQVNLK
ncbi:alanine--tRNA ligase [Marinicella sp. S1101]|uniref:alanine--tRNA ligase n=1 Tax=Marinicella marina TaxID=2996016 RepID=UPI002260BB37|nr:alanine--tRNA ligase [Marinicella marina]MCX7554726.1 alanine--tRNA ligase [Marinicella marina]MDJ1141458.1 alanine--tRNA ligase [Marinicella marina]